MSNTHFSGPINSTNGFVGDITGLINGVNFVIVEGAPVAQKTAKNTIVLDSTNSDLYINVGDEETPSYMKITRATT